MSLLTLGLYVPFPANGLFLLGGCVLAVVTFGYFCGGIADFGKTFLNGLDVGLFRIVLDSHSLAGEGCFD